MFEPILDAPVWIINSMAFTASLKLRDIGQCEESFGDIYNGLKTQEAEDYLVWWWLRDKSEKLKNASTIPDIRKRIISLATRVAYSRFTETGNAARFNRYGIVLN